MIVRFLVEGPRLEIGYITTCYAKGWAGPLSTPNGVGSGQHQSHLPLHLKTFRDKQLRNRRLPTPKDLTIMVGVPHSKGCLLCRERRIRVSRLSLSYSEHEADFRLVRSVAPSMYAMS